MKPWRQFKLFACAHHLLLAMLLVFSNCTQAAEPEVAVALGALKRLDYAAAAELLEKLAADGDARAQTALAGLLDSGNSDKPTNLTPIELIREAAEQGYAPAAFDLGNRYFLGQSVERDIEEAAHWWRLADSPQALFNLGLAHANGDIAPQDFQAARESFTRAADLGLAEASFALAVLQLKSPQSNHDLAAACANFERAANNELAIAQFNLGVLHEQGISCIRDEALARHWYARALDGGIEAAAAPLTRLGPIVQGPATGMETTVIGNSAWAFEQDASHYTLQIASGASERAITKILRSYDEAIERGVIDVSAGEGRLYVALLGNFSRYIDALNYLNALPDDLNKRKPWIRRFQSVHEQLASNQR